MGPITYLLHKLEQEQTTLARENLQSGKQVHLIKNEQAPDHVYLKGRVEGNFNYFYTTAMSLDVNEQGEVTVRTVCGCYERRQKLMCTHCAALLLYATGGELQETDISPEDFYIPTAVTPPQNEESYTPVAPAQDDVPDTPVFPDEDFTAAVEITQPSDEEFPPAPTSDSALSPVAEAKPFTPKSMEILLGQDLETQEDVYWYPNDTAQVLNTNTGIIGTMGTGKTQMTKSLVTQLYQKSCHNYDGSPLGILIFDYKGDYNENHPDFIRMTNARVYRPFHFPLNPFYLSLGKNNKPALPLHVASTFTATIGKIYHLGDVQKQTLLDCIRDAYLAQGIRPESPITWNRRAPTFQNVYEQYDKAVLKKGDSLGSAMKRLQNFQIFEGDPMRTRSLGDLLRGVVVMDLSQYDPDIQDLIVAITLDLFYAYMKTLSSSSTDGRYRQVRQIILVDEADNFMGADFPSLRKILKEGREFGIGTILSTQFLNHFITGDDDYSSYIFTWIVHRVANLKSSNVEYVFGTKAKTQDHEEISEEIKNLQKHQSMVKVGQQTARIQDLPFWKLMAEASPQ